MTNVGETLAHASLSIDPLDAQYLLADLLGIGRASLLAHPERLLTSHESSTFATHSDQRARGMPVAYLIGKREFYGREFYVNDNVLIPRPETELLVEQALVRLPGDLVPAIRASASVSPSETAERPSMLDLGTGSGAIAVSLALERPDAMVVAADISSDALKIAGENARRLHAAVTFVASDWYANLVGRKFDLIVSNPPYVSGGDVHLSQGDLRFEPQIALTDESGDGLRSIRTIIDGAAAHLRPRGWLLVEHGYDQANACRELLLKAGFANLTSVSDLAGIPRVAGGQIG